MEFSDYLVTFGFFKGFYYYFKRKTLTKLDIPKSVKSIKNYGFTSLTEISIPNTVTSIGDYAFLNCKLLTNISIPNTVTSIGVRAFLGCSSLTNINIPDSVTSIKELVFQDCTSLTNITIPDSVTSIGYQAFFNCRSLKSINIPDSVIYIDEKAFWGCKSLTNISIPNSVIYFGQDVFEGCESLKCELPEPRSGLKKVTIYMGHRAAGPLMVNAMSPSEIYQMLIRSNNDMLAHRIWLYGKNNEIVQQKLNIQVPNISSKENLESFVNRAFPVASRLPYTDIVAVPTSSICYFIVVEKETTPIVTQKSEGQIEAVLRHIFDKELGNMVDNYAHYSSLGTVSEEETKMADELVAGGFEAHSAIINYLLSCARGGQTEGWWYNSARLVELLSKFSNVDLEKDYKKLMDCQSNIWEFQTQVKDVAEQELLKLKKSFQGNQNNGIIPAENAHAELMKLDGKYGADERLKRTIAIKNSVEFWSDESKAFYYYIIAQTLGYRNPKDERQYAFYAAQVFYNPAGTSLGWYAFHELDEFKELEPTPENAKMLHEKYPLPTSFDELIEPIPAV